MMADVRKTSDAATCIEPLRPSLSLRGGAIQQPRQAAAEEGAALVTPRAQSPGPGRAWVHSQGRRGRKLRRQGSRDTAMRC